MSFQSSLTVAAYSGLSQTWFSFFCPHHVACGILVPQPGIEPRPQHWKRWVLTTGLPGSSWPWYIFEEYWSGGFVDCPQISVFLMISLEVMFSRKEYHTGEVFFSSRLIKVMVSTWVIPGDINLEVVFTGFFHCKITIFPLPYFIHKRPITKPSLHSRGRELHSISWTEGHKRISGHMLKPHTKKKKKKNRVKAKTINTHRQMFWGGILWGFENTNILKSFIH